ncbi:hypothetical protein LINPERPRIM_LOCUS39204, partial [Linum perenne]
STSRSSTLSPSFSTSQSSSDPGQRSPTRLIAPCACRSLSRRTNFGCSPTVATLSTWAASTRGFSLSPLDLYSNLPSTMEQTLQTLLQFG